MSQPEQELSNAFTRLKKNSRFIPTEDEINGIRAGVVDHFFIKPSQHHPDLSVFGWVYGHTPESDSYFSDPELSEIYAELKVDNLVIPHIFPNTEDCFDSTHGRVIKSMLSFLQAPDKAENKPGGSYFSKAERLALRETKFGLEGYLFNQVASQIIFTLYNSAYSGGKIVYFEVFHDRLQIGTQIDYLNKEWISVNENLIDEELPLTKRIIEGEDGTKILLSSQFISPTPFINSKSLRCIYYVTKTQESAL